MLSPYVFTVGVGLSHLIDLVSPLYGCQNPDLNLTILQSHLLKRSDLSRIFAIVQDCIILTIPNDLSFL